MSENLDLVRSIIAAHERGDYASAEWADPEIEYVIADGPDAGVFKGRAAMAKAWRAVLSAYRDYSNVVEEIREIDDERVLVLGSFRGGGKASGIGAPERIRTGAALYQVRNGKVIRHALYFDRDNALTDLGIKE
jgi:ketosteroid isomerase-like protein